MPEVTISSMSGGISLQTLQPGTLAPLSLLAGAGLAIMVLAADSNAVTSEPPPRSMFTQSTAGPSHVDFGPQDVLADTFRALAAQWIADTSTFSSDLGSFVMHWAYQRIIGLGPPAVPFVLAELVRHPDHWGWALSAITGENPVPAEAEGDIEAIAEAWIRWGRARNLIS
jgi:hypothetical protein